MRDLWDAISRNPALLIFLVLGLLSWLGNMAGGAAKKAQREAQRKAQAQRAQQRPAAAMPRQQPRGQQPQLRPQTASSAPTAEEIAAEIRRVMGFEAEPRRVEPAAPPPTPVAVIEDHQRWAAERVRPAAGSVKTRPPAASRRARPVRTRHRGSNIDLSNPAAAFVMMEVLGKPRALRDFDL